MTTRLKKMIMNRGLTQSEVARRAEMDVGRLSCWVTGAANPSPETLERLARVLACKPSEIDGKVGE